MRRLLSVKMLAMMVIMLGAQVFAQTVTDSPEAKQRLAWWEQHQQMAVSSPFKELAWQFIGPERPSGRVTDVAVHESDTNTIYAAVCSGGVWKTTDQGDNWFPVFENAASTSIGDVTIAPSNPNIVWVGGGEANILRSSMAGTGAYKSLDAGKTWTYMGLADTQHIARIVIHPTNPDIVYVCASGHEYTHNSERGVYKTIDGGKIWQRVFHKNERTASMDLTMDPSDPETLLMSTAHRLRQRWDDPKAGPESGIWKTSDGGRNWKLLTNGLPTYDRTERIGLEFCKTEPNVVYALINNHHPKPGEEVSGTDAYGRPRTANPIGADVWRSDDKGETWKWCEGSPAIGGQFATYGWVFAQIRVDPNDADTIYIMGLGIKKSTNGGKSFDSRLGGGPHGDHHGMWINPKDSNYVLNCNDGGVDLSLDGGLTWRGYPNLPTTTLFNCAVDMSTPFKVYASLQDNGSYRGVVDLSQGRDKIPQQVWEGAPGGEDSHHAIDPTNPNVVYSAGFYGNISRTIYDENGRQNSTNIKPKAAPGEPPLRGQWMAPFIISPHAHNTIYHGMQYVFKSTNRGDDWRRISPDLTNYDPAKQGDISYSTLFALAESPVKMGLIYAGTDDGNVQVTRNDGGSWKLIVKDLPPERCISRVEPSRFAENVVYMTVNGKRHDDFTPYVYKSTDYGDNWIDISSNIPGGPVNVIREDPANKNILYAGTDIGVYVSLNGGENWQALACELASVFVFDLAIHPRDDIMIAATHGRGAYAIDVRPIREYAKNNR